MNLKLVFWWVFFLTLGLKIFLADLVPLTGDEVYYIFWGRHPALGYYDHPPMTGWMQALAYQIGNSPIAMRIFPILVFHAVILVIRDIIFRLRLIRSDWGITSDYTNLVGILFLLTPIHLIPVIATDTPLVLFTILSVYFVCLGLEYKSITWFFVAGIFLGLAYLSKFFAVFLIAAYLFYFLFIQRSRVGWNRLIAILLGAFPFFLINVYWNYENCWINFSFNLSTRHQDEALSFQKPLWFLAYQVYLMSPVVLLFVLRRYQDWKKLFRDPIGSLIVCSFLIPLLCFFLTSFKVSQGLHWMLSFYPAFFVLLPFILTKRQLTFSAGFMGIFLALHLIPVAAFSMKPYEYWKDRNFYRGLILFGNASEIAKQFHQIQDSRITFATDGYTLSSLLSYHSGKEFSVFGSESNFGRHDDLITNFKDRDQQSFAIFTRWEHKQNYFKRYFKDLDKIKFQVSGVDYFIFIGRRFNYSRYRKEVLKSTYKRFYRAPPWLPQGMCPLKDWYKL